MDETNRARIRAHTHTHSPYLNLEKYRCWNARRLTTTIGLKSSLYSIAKLPGVDRKREIEKDRKREREKKNERERENSSLANVT